MNPGQSSSLYAVDQNGVRGMLDLTAVPPQGSQSRLVLVRLSDGTSVYADASLFVEKEPGLLFFPGSFAQLRQSSVAHNTAVSAANTVNTVNSANTVNNEQLVVPVLAEQLRIARQQVVTGGVRVHKTVRERVETVNEPVIEEQLDVERVPVNRFVEGTPSVRYEGDAMIVPLLEEVIVVEKRLVLREEVYIRKRRTVVNRPQEVVLRREEATLEPLVPDANRTSAANAYIAPDERRIK